MSWHTTGSERRVCPPEFQEQIDALFGSNRFGGSMFRLAWGQTEVIQVAGLRSYEDRLMCHNVPCWNILRWRSPEAFGTPEVYYLINQDTESGLCALGEYPWEGRYEILQPLVNREVRDGRMIVDAFPLDARIMDVIIPLMVEAQKATYWEARAAQQAMEAAEEKATVNRIADRLMNDLPSFYGPVSYSQQGCRTALIDRKMAEISKVWSRYSKSQIERLPRGFYQGN